MKSFSRLSPSRAAATLALCAVLLAASSCAGSNDAGDANTTATTAVTPPATAASPAAQNLSVVPRPQRIEEMARARGEQESAAPMLRIVEPREGATVNGSTINLRLALSGDLKGYQPMQDPATGMGNHVHVILDNQPYEAYYQIGEPFELRNVTEGRHTIRVFASRPWHESYKNEGSFQMVTFTVRGGGDASGPTTTATGQTMATNSANSHANAAASPSASPAREGKDYGPSQAGQVDRAKPLLTYSRPKGEYKGAEADPVMIDFWLSNAKLEADGGEYRVRYSVDGGPAQHLSRWEPVWLQGWGAGKHTVKLELVDRNGNLVDNGGYNSTTREITVVK